MEARGAGKTVQLFTSVGKNTPANYSRLAGWYVYAVFYGAVIICTCFRQMSVLRILMVPYSSPDDGFSIFSTNKNGRLPGFSVNKIL